MESRDHAMMMAEQLTKLFSDAGAQFIFKSSYDKANRSSISSARGIGMDEGLRILQEVAETFGCPVITDVHESGHCAPAAEAVDILQIPAFLCRQTDLLIAAEIGKPINVKRSILPLGHGNAAEKIASSEIRIFIV